MTGPVVLAPKIVIVAYRADAHLDACLTGLGGAADVVVVDNDAAAATRAVVERHAAGYVAMGTNVGFAAAVNVGLRACSGRDVLLLNPDARIGVGDLRALQSALHEPGTHRAAVGPRLTDERGVHQLARWPMPSPSQVWLDAFGAMRWWRGRTFVVGAALLLRADALRELGGLDERYFLYAEEADWQLRALRAGWQVHVVDSVSCTHVGAASSRDPVVREEHAHRSAGLFAQRWYGRRGQALMRAGGLTAAARRSVLGPAGARARNRRALHRLLRTEARE